MHENSDRYCMFVLKLGGKLGVRILGDEAKFFFPTTEQLIESMTYPQPQDQDTSNVII